MTKSSWGWCLPFLALSPGLLSCKSDKPVVQPDKQASPLASTSNVLVINEGGFMYNNASLTYFNPVSGEVTEDVFQPANQRALGDVAQSAVVWNKRLYVVVNNSGKIEVMEPGTFRSLRTITGLVSPRYLMPVSNSKAYVTDLYANKISVVNLNSLKVEKEIPLLGDSERMLYHLGKVYVCNFKQKYLYVIDPQKDLLTDSILIGKGANSLVADKFDRLIVACGGYQIAQEDTRLVYLNPYSGKVEKSVPISSGYPSSLTLNPLKDSIYFLNAHVYKMAIDQESPGTPFISGSLKNLYSLGIDPVFNQVFVSNAFDYQQKGKVYVHSAAGTPLTQFDAGLIPGEFCFY